MTTDQRLDSERKLLRLRLALAVAIVALLGWIGYSLFESNLRAAQSEANAQTLARDIGTVCQEQGKLMINDRDLCVKGETVLANPTDAIAGAKGDKGNDGERGPIGPIGPVGATGPKGDMGPLGPFGPKGEKGAPGDDGLPGLPVHGEPGTDGAPGMMGPVGPIGATGEPGKDGAPGAPGADGAPGTPGKDGVDGKDGRGIQSAYCGDDGRWAITYTDGVVADGGQCRNDPGPPVPPITPGVTP